MRTPAILTLAGCCLAACVAITACNKPKTEEKQEAPAAAKSDAKPSLAVDKNAYSFGAVKQGELAKVTVSISNKGDADLILGAIEASCGCTATNPSATTLAPGASATIEVTVDTTGREGAFNKSVTINSNDPLLPAARLAITGNIVQDVKIEPIHLHMGEVVKGQPASMDFAITIADPENVKMTGIALAEETDFNIEKVSDEAAGVSKWKLNFNGSEELRLFQSAVNITLEGSNAKSISTPVYAKVTTDLRFPSLLFMRKVRGKYLERKISFQSRTGKPFKITKVEDSEGLLDLVLTPGENGAVDLTINVKDHDKEYDGLAEYTITAHTTSPDHPKAVITYSVVPKPVREYAIPGAKVPSLQ